MSEEKKNLEIKERLIRLNEVKEICRFGSFIKIIYFGNENPEPVEYPNDELAEYYFQKHIHDKIKNDNNDIRHEWLLVSNNPSLLD